MFERLGRNHLHTNQYTNQYTDYPVIAGLHRRRVSVGAVIGNTQIGFGGLFEFAHLWDQGSLIMRFFNMFLICPQHTQEELDKFLQVFDDMAAIILEQEELIILKKSDQLSLFYTLIPSHPLAGTQTRIINKHWRLISGTRESG